MTHEPAQDDPIIAAYDKGIVDRSMRSYYGADNFCNVGYWSEACSGLGEASQALVAKLIAHIPESAESILDVGCGLGATTRQIKLARPAADVTGVNISEFQVQEARRNAPNCHFQCMDAANLSLEDASFDALVSVEAAFHFNTRAAFLAHAFRVLKPGGVLAMADLLPNPGPMAQQITVWPVADVNHLDSCEAYASLLSSLGFADVLIEDITANTWAAWCKNIEKSLPLDCQSGVISRETMESHLAILPALLASVKSYMAVYAVKPK